MQLIQTLQIVDACLNEVLGKKLSTNEKTGILTAIADSILAVELHEKERVLQNRHHDKVNKVLHQIPTIVSDLNY